MKVIFGVLFLAFFPFVTHSFATPFDPHAGMVAAREMGLAHYVEFQRHGKPDSAALFFWRGNWWIYHPSLASMKTAMADPTHVPLAVTLVIEGASGPILWKTVRNTPTTAVLANGCLPRAVAEVHKYGGGILVTQNHAQSIR